MSKKMKLDDLEALQSISSEQLNGIKVLLRAVIEQFESAIIKADITSPTAERQLLLRAAEAQGARKLSDALMARLSHLKAKHDV